MSTTNKGVKSPIRGQALTEFVVLLPIVGGLMLLGGLLVVGPAARSAVEAAAFLSSRAQLYGHPCPALTTSPTLGSLARRFGVRTDCRSDNRTALTRYETSQPPLNLSVQLSVGSRP